MRPLAASVAVLFCLSVTVTKPVSLASTYFSSVLVSLEMLDNLIHFGRCLIYRDQPWFFMH